MEPLQRQALDDEQRVMFDAIVEGPRGRTVVTEAGTLRGPFDPLLRTPAAGRLLEELGATLRYASSLGGDLRELVVLVVARHWRCGFEWKAHLPIALREGLIPEELAALRAGTAPAFADRTQQVVYDATTELLTTHRLDDVTYAGLRAVLAEAEVTELIVVAGYYQLLAMLLEALEISSTSWEDEPPS